MEIHGEHAYVLILRENFPQLRDLMGRCRRVFLASGAKFQKSEKTWTFPNGGRVQFGHVEDGYDPYWGQEYTMIVIDEVTRTIETKHDFDMLIASLRNSHGIPGQIILTSNPGGIGHAWIKERYMNVPPLTVIKEEVEDPDTGDVVTFERVYIPARVSDNPKLPREYKLQLLTMGEKEQRAYVGGDWDAFSGSVFRLERDIHIWTWQQFEERTGSKDIPAHWVRYRMMDWGYSHPFAIVWIAVDDDGRGYVYREWYGVKHAPDGQIEANVGVSMQPTMVGDRIKAIETAAKEKVAYGWTGPDLNSAGTGDTSAGIKRIEYFQQSGVFFDFWNAGKDSRAAKKTALHERLAYPVKDGEIQDWPGLVFLFGEDMAHPKRSGELTNGARHCIRTIPTLEYDPAGGGEDVDSDGEDHCYDAVAAWCLMRPWKPKPKPSELEQMFASRKKGRGSWMSR